LAKRNILFWETETARDQPTHDDTVRSEAMSSSRLPRNEAVTEWQLRDLDGKEA
jgi:hypothetical protein